MILEIAAVLAMRAMEEPKPPEPKPKPTPVVESQPWSVDWNAVAACEAYGDWSWVSNGNGYWFVLQFTRSTWLAFGGTEAELNAGIAPSKERLIEVAERVLAAQGRGAWPTCLGAA